jgi:HrpA-like RNA helicase
LSIFVPANALHEVPGPKIPTNLYDVATRLIAALDEKREITRYGRNATYDWLSTVRPAILVFLPGLGEIETMHKFLNVTNFSSNFNFSAE